MAHDTAPLTITDRASGKTLHTITVARSDRKALERFEAVARDRGIAIESTDGRLLKAELTVKGWKDGAGTEVQTDAWLELLGKKSALVTAVIDAGEDLNDRFNKAAYVVETVMPDDPEGNAEVIVRSTKARDVVARLTVRRLDREVAKLHKKECAERRPPVAPGSAKGVLILAQIVVLGVTGPEGAPMEDEDAIALLRDYDAVTHAVAQGAITLNDLFNGDIKAQLGN